MDAVVITVKTEGITAPADLVVQYQVIEPGKYVALNEPSYGTDWTSVPLDKGQPATSSSDSKTYTVTLPKELQKHRRLIRYRLYSKSTDAVVAPAANDPQRNFAYFVYDGIPEWRAAINPNGAGPAGKLVTFSPEVMRSVQAYHLISHREAIENVTWRDPKFFAAPSASEYKYTGTLVADGKVYDHIRFRARGGNWRHAMGKNMWKIDFLKGHNLEARDNWGRRYKTKWGKLNLGACIQQGDYGMRGEQGMFEAVAFRIFNLTGVEASHTHWIQLRIIDEAEENPADQYRGDFWGLYLAVENPDDDFLEEHRLPEGNLYKMDMGRAEPAHIAKDAASDSSDVRRFMGDLMRKPNEQWWRTNVALPSYYSYRSIVECIHHYDIGGGKNYYYFLHPNSKLWQVVPWDLDLTWGDQMYGDGAEPFLRSGVLQSAAIRAEYEARLTEIRDLLFNPEQMGALIDEYAEFISDPKGGPSMVDADRAKWDYHPIMSSRYIDPSKSRPGLFYRQSPTRDFRGMLQLMKSYVEHRGDWIDQYLLGKSPLPATPTIESPREFDFAASHLRLQLSGGTSPGKVKWRLAEITDGSATTSPKTQPRKYEIEALWQADGGNVAEIPTGQLAKGHTYRVRARIPDEAGRWSHWSPPVQFTVPTDANPVTLPEKSAERKVERRSVSPTRRPSRF